MDTSLEGPLSEDTTIAVPQSEDITVQKCSICLEPFNEDSVTIHTCADHEPFHARCMESYVYLKLESFNAGFSPMILCPNQQHGKRYLSTKLINSIMNREEAERLDTMIKANMNFHCGGCGRDISLLTKYVESESSQSLPTEVMTMLEKFNEGHVEPAVFHAAILQAFPDVPPIDLHDIVISILAKIPDANFRSYLQNYHYNKFPRMPTPCCKTVHCFRCKIKGFHEGKSCSEYAANTIEDIVQCPSCFTNLTKGDGCNLVTCYCSTKFNWETQKRTQFLNNQFSTMYPEDTVNYCCQILLNTIEGNVEGAQAWRRLHEYEVRATARRLWRRLYPYCPEKAFLNKSSRIDSGLRDDLQISFRSKLEHLKNESRIAVDSMLETYAPTTKDRVALLSLHEQGILPFMYDFLVPKLSDYKNSRKNSNDMDYIIPSVERFLLLYGTRNSRIDYADDAQYVGHHVRERADHLLTWERREQTATSAPPTSVWIPARFPQSTCKILLTKWSQDEHGLFSFHLCPKNRVNEHSFMRSFAHVGIFSSNDGFQILSGGSNVTLGKTRKLQAGDILTIKIDLLEHCIDLCVNDTEYFHTVIDDEKSNHDYNNMVFGATLPVGTSMELVGYRDEQTIIPFSFSKRPSNCLLKFFRSIEKEIASGNFRFANRDFVSKYAQLYENKYLSKVDSYNLDVVCSELRQMLHDIINFRNFSSKFSWEYAVSGVCFLYTAELKMIAIKGRAFREMFQGSAAFMAASLFSPSIGYLCKQKNLRLDAIAYMRTFPEEMNSWYDNSNALHAFIIPKLNSSSVCKCRCLPRHCVTCSGFAI